MSKLSFQETMELIFQEIDHEIELENGSYHPNEVTVNEVNEYLI